MTVFKTCVKEMELPVIQIIGFQLSHISFKGWDVFRRHTEQCSHLQNVTCMIPKIILIPLQCSIYCVSYVLVKGPLLLMVRRLKECTKFSSDQSKQTRSF